MFTPVLETPQRLRGESTWVAAVGSVLAAIFRDTIDQPPPREMQELLRPMREHDEPESYWRRFYASEDTAAP